MDIRTAERIRSMVTSRQMLEHAGVRVDGRGFACCPLHREKTASLKVYNDPRRGWHCFGCGRGGSVIDLAMAIFDTDFKGACARLNDEFMLGLDMGWEMTDEEKAEYRARLAKEQAEREKRRLRVQRAEQAYWAAYDEWLENDRILTDQAPGNPDEPLTDAFVRAAVHRSEIRDRLEDAETEWRRARDDQWK